MEKTKQNKKKKKKKEISLLVFLCITAICFYLITMFVHINNVSIREQIRR